MKVAYITHLIVPISLLCISILPISPPTKASPNRDFAHALMEEKFIFFYELLNMDKKPMENLQELLSRSKKEIVFIENLTGIASTYPTDRMGKTFIRKEDFIEWTVWYFKNKPFVVWDEDMKKILVKRP